MGYGREGDEYVERFVDITQMSDLESAIDEAEDLLNEICGLMDRELQKILTPLVNDIDDFIRDCKLEKEEEDMALV